MNGERQMVWKNLILYLAVQSFTLGPNNLTCIYLGGKGGLKATRKFLTGSMASLFVKALICGTLNIVMAKTMPAVVNVLKWFGAAYMLYLAWIMASSGWKDEASMTGQQTESTYRSGIILQLLNAKSWIAAISVFAVYVIPHTTSFAVIFAVSAIFLIIALAFSLVWVFFGAALSRFMNRYKKLFGIIMGLSLVYCAITALI